MINWNEKEKFKPLSDKFSVTLTPSEQYDLIHFGRIFEEEEFFKENTRYTFYDRTTHTTNY